MGPICEFVYSFVVQVLNFAVRFLLLGFFSVSDSGFIINPKFFSNHSLRRLEIDIMAVVPS